MDVEELFSGVEKQTNKHTSELLSELEELTLDYQDGSNTITSVLKSRSGKQQNSESDGDVTRDTNQAVILIIRNGGQA